MPADRRKFLICAAAATVAAGCGRKAAPLDAIPAGATVLALGDSITYGTGATPETSYPTVLARKTGWNVVNAGIPGDVSSGALDRLPALLRDHTPRLVIVSIGGNDFLRGLPEADTRSNVRAICSQAAAAGAKVLLVAIPRFSLLAGATGSLGDHALYADIAGELKIPLHAGGWSAVLSDKSLRADPIHPTGPGYAKFTEGLLQTLAATGLWRK